MNTWHAGGRADSCSVLQDALQCGAAGGNVASQHMLFCPHWAALHVAVGDRALIELLCTHSVFCRVGGTCLQVSGCPISIVAKKRHKVPLPLRCTRAVQDRQPRALNDACAQAAMQP